MAAEGGFGPAKDTAVGEIVTILLSGSDPDGLKLKADRDGYAAVIVDFERVKGKFSTIQRHGGVHPTDVLYQINESNLENMPFDDVVAMLRNRNLLRKQLKFINNNEYYARKKKPVTNKTDVSTRQSFLSKVKRARVVETSTKYAEYEIGCQWRIVSADKDKVVQWSVWKRFSEFETLHASLRKSLGWQLDSIPFPHSYSFTLNKYTPDFIEKRREELNIYWQGVIGIGKVCEFDKHHCNDELKKFLDVDTACANYEQGITMSSEAAADEPAANRPNRRLSMKSGQGQSSRRLSSRNMNVGKFEEGSVTSSVTSAPRVSKRESRTGTSSPPPPTASSGSTATVSVSAAPAAPAAPAMKMSPVMTENIAKYTKMKSMLPEGAVRQRMGADGCNDSEIDAFFAGDSAPPPPPPPVAAPAAAKSAPPVPSAPQATAPPSKSPALPPKTTARANLLGDIAKRRID